MKTKEPLLVIVKTDGVESRRYTEPSRVVFKDRGGKESVSFLGGRRSITRENGLAVLTLDYRKAKVFRLEDIVKKFT